MQPRRNYYYTGFWNVDGERREVATYNADFIAKRTIDFLRQSDSNSDLTPWFAYLAPMAPHAPSTPARRHRDAKVPPFDGNRGGVERDLSDKHRYVRTKVA